MILRILNISRINSNTDAQISNYVRIFFDGSLIMLSTVVAAIPMSNMNHFSDVMAQGYNNNYGYDNNKQISYNNSYEDMKKYSTYPTKDKKYVCQTGQFQ